MTPAERRSASGIITGVLPVTVTPGSETPLFRQAAGWGFIGVPTIQGEPPVVEDEVVRFVYRRRRRLKAQRR